MLQDLNGEEPIIYELDNTLPNPNSLGRMLICGGIEYSRAIQAGLKVMLSEEKSKVWLPKSSADLEAEWKAYRESKIRRPL